MKFATFDAAGFPAAFFGEDIHGSRTRPVYGAAPEPTEADPYPMRPVIGEQPNPDCLIPAEAIEITDDQWMDMISHPGQRRWVGGKVIVYELPVPPDPVPAAVSDRQFFQALAVRELITEDEALDAVGPGIIPPAMQALIAELPADRQFGAKMLLRGATTFERAHPLAALIGQLYGWDDAALDDLWRYAATL